MPKVLVTGDFAYSMYEGDLCEGLRAAGAEVSELPVRPLYGPIDSLRRAQEKYVLGFGPWRANRALVARVRQERPDLVIAWRAPWLRSRAIGAVRALGAKVVLANNDDPFGPDRALHIWRAFRRAIPAADVVCVYRDVNVAEAIAAGAKRVHVLRSWFNPARHRPLAPSAQERARFGCEVVFAGHAEDDGRLEALDALVQAGLGLKLFGSGWDRFARGRPIEKLIPAPRLEGDDYVKALCAAQCALVFLSGRNRDDYTRRCFEIPACGVLMLAQRTPLLTSWFREGEEALFFNSPAELVSQARAVLADPLRAHRIAAAGRARVLAGANDPLGRARELLSLIA